MSYSTVWKVYKTTATSYAEFGNSHGSAPPVWDWLGQNYLGWKEYGWLHNSDLRPMWELWEDVSVPVHMRFALLATFDDGVVEVEDLARAAELASRVYDTLYNPQKVNHWEKLSIAYIELSAIKDKRVQGIALGCTSVSDPWWYRKEREPFNIIHHLDLSGKDKT